ncbi:orf57 [Trichoplusia ni single nucleopolyhedrovirus]|uniref:Orf57 n=1 Tax=Trichoplusia ni single nucleopolyhedrovirus TaxID=332054 RepID=Q462A8_9ABAC|nr:orf57 [Trichoplusia ni single nucleopolyhedrovirus]AAZ67428.1 orf57 [Trichoplusia ni single nucleopolyhedrovirus]
MANNSIRWRMLNSARVEVSPESREHAWKDLVIDTLLASPKDDSYRTMINKANFENFDYNRPLIYDIKTNTVLINSEFLNRALNRPSGSLDPLNVMSAHVFLAFICSLLLIVLTALIFDQNDNGGWLIKLNDG